LFEIWILIIGVFSGDHHWWWRSFCSSGTSGIYVFLYAIYYYFKELQINSLISTLLYFGHMLVLSSIFTLITGTIGFLATFLFVKKIYSLIKSD
jgi:transmembrane 9 superfamily member 2/4